MLDDNDIIADTAFKEKVNSTKERIICTSKKKKKKTVTIKTNSYNASLELTTFLNLTGNSNLNFIKASWCPF